MDDKELCYLKLEISKANFESDPLARWTACIFGCASQVCVICNESYSIYQSEQVLYSS